jgi:hypothetical protein
MMERTCPAGYVGLLSLPCLLEPMALSRPSFQRMCSSMRVGMKNSMNEHAIEGRCYACIHCNMMVCERHFESTSHTRTHVFLDLRAPIPPDAEIAKFFKIANPWGMLLGEALACTNIPGRYLHMLFFSATCYLFWVRQKQVHWKTLSVLS